MAEIRTLIPAVLGWYVTGDLGPYTIYTNARGKIVWFPRSPPLMPPTIHQTQQRQNFKLAAQAWRSFDAATRAAWERVARRTSMQMTGYNLFVWRSTHTDITPILTAARQAGVPINDLQL